MSNIDKTLHDAYKSDAYYTPTLTPVYCHRCGTRLKTYYAEDRLYAVKCGFCETVTLVRASNPTEAMRYVGSYTTTSLENAENPKIYRENE